MPQLVGSFLPAVAASRQVLMKLFLVALLSVLLKMLLFPGTWSSMMTGNGLLPNRCSLPPCCLPMTLKENKANGQSSQQVVEISYCVKLGIKVKPAEGDSGRLGG